MPIKAPDVVVGSTVEVFLHHNYPLALVGTKDAVQWQIVRSKSGAKFNHTTHIVGQLSSIDVGNRVYTVHGGPYAGAGLGFDFRSHGDNQNAMATLPWNYITQMWIITQKDIPEISIKHGRLNVIKTRVIF